MNKKSVRDLVAIDEAFVLCRVDFNVPMQDGEITDDTRIKAALPTIAYLIEKNAKVILVSHLGRPKGKVNLTYSLAPVAKRLSELLKCAVQLGDVDLTRAKEQASMLAPGEVMLLENIRFYPGEEQNDETFVEQLVAFADTFVNDAFGAAHRAHASTAGVPSHLENAVAGFLMEKELKVLGGALHHPKKPFVAIVGGAKVKDKIAVIDHLLDKVDTLIVGGGLAYTFIQAKGFPIGRSLLEEDKLEMARGFIAKAERNGVKLLMQVDAVVANEVSEAADVSIVDMDHIPADHMGLDIGPKSVTLFREAILDAKLVVWNGPMGVFEMTPFANGTKEVAMAMAEAKAYSVIGGGDSAAAVAQFGLAEKIDHISTGGGASLEFMEGKQLPGVEALSDRDEKELEWIKMRKPIIAANWKMNKTMR